MGTYTTPVLGLPAPDLNETPDVPRDIKALADMVESSLIGTTGPLNRVKKIFVGQGVYTIGYYGTVSISFPVGYFSVRPLVWIQIADSYANMDDAAGPNWIDDVVTTSGFTIAGFPGTSIANLVRLNVLAIQER